MNAWSSTATRSTVPPTRAEFRRLATELKPIFDPRGAVLAERPALAFGDPEAHALERVVEQLRAALRVERKRVATKPTAAARERRLEQKRRRSRTKRLRGRAPEE